MSWALELHGAPWCASKHQCGVKSRQHTSMFASVLVLLVPLAFSSPLFTDHPRRPSRSGAGDALALFEAARIKLLRFSIPGE
jgi:hypothetical protein